MREKCSAFDFLDMQTIFRLFDRPVVRCMERWDNVMSVMQAPAGLAVKAPLIANSDLMSGKPSLIGLTREEMGEALAEIGVPQKQVKMRVSQLWNWLYVRGVSDFDNMTNVAKELREKLKAAFTIARPEIVEEQISNDGTRKWLMRFPPRGWAVRRDRDGLYSRRGTRHVVHIEPGGLFADLLFLSHRHAAAGAQPDGGGNSLPAFARPRPAG